MQKGERVETVQLSRRAKVFYQSSLIDAHLASRLLTHCPKANRSIDGDPAVKRSSRLAENRRGCRPERTPASAPPILADHQLATTQLNNAPPPQRARRPDHRASTCARRGCAAQERPPPNAHPPRQAATPDPARAKPPRRGSAHDCIGGEQLHGLYHDGEGSYGDAGKDEDVLEEEKRVGHPVRRMSPVAVAIARNCWDAVRFLIGAGFSAKPAVDVACDFSGTRSHQVPDLSRAMDAAAQRSMRLVQFLQDFRTEGSAREAMDAAARESLEVVMDEAASTGRPDVVPFLHLNRSEGCTTAAMDAAVEKWAIFAMLRQAAEAKSEDEAWYEESAQLRKDVFLFLHANRSEGCTKKAMDRASHFGHIEVIRFLHENRRERCSDSAVLSSGLILPSHLRKGHRASGCGRSRSARRSSHFSTTITPSTFPRASYTSLAPITASISFNSCQRGRMFPVLPTDATAALNAPPLNTCSPPPKPTMPHLCNELVEHILELLPVRVAIALRRKVVIRSHIRHGKLQRQIQRALNSFDVEALQFFASVYPAWKSTSTRWNGIGDVSGGEGWDGDADKDEDVLEEAKRVGHPVWRAPPVGAANYHNCWDVVWFLVGARFSTKHAVDFACRFGADFGHIQALLALVPIARAYTENRREIVDYLIKIGAPVPHGAADAAARNGHFWMVKGLQERALPNLFNASTMDAAARDSLEIVMFLHHFRTEGCTTKAMDEAASARRLDIVDFLHVNRSEGCTTVAMNAVVAPWAFSARAAARSNDQQDKAFWEEIAQRLKSLQGDPLISPPPLLRALLPAHHAERVLPSLIQLLVALCPESYAHIALEVAASSERMLRKLYEGGIRFTDDEMKLMFDRPSSKASRQRVSTCHGLLW
ncbi:hypothetical protein BDK51DRAFT_51573 [Blyttiomyces helicus]|uniref:Uncharacterized protein n=1 Tax=Blyttiomyces helicus TaxID=388810 RepID=A0A4P9WIZ4_9FUNG|nr:hypothetical protein BDK51DRAFT_51573 [Blyttiomyces helicus]|eukprot:RKO91110.1 hypothetical protein BDK51DRAFT_51573 [Blyttiomyces helicus]